MKIKKILLIGHFNPNPKIYTYAASFARTFTKLNYQVTTFNYKNPNFNIPVIGEFLLNHKLQSTIKKNSPDLIFMLKANKIKYKTLNKIKKFSTAKLINFYPDNPFTFWNGNSNEHILLSLPLYDVFLIWSHQLIPILRAAGAKNVSYFPFAFDQDIFSIKTVEKNTPPPATDICFVGSWDEDRERWLTELMLKMPQLNLAIWGNRWHEKLSQNSILKSYLKGYAIYGIDMLRVFQSSKIVLNFIRKQNLDAHNMRTIEVPACKAFLLTERTTEQAQQLFEEGKSVECFGDINELVDKIRFYLSDMQAREKITTRGYDRVQEYSIEKTISTILKKFD